MASADVEGVSGCQYRLYTVYCIAHVEDTASLPPTVITARSRSPAIPFKTLLLV